MWDASNGTELAVLPAHGGAFGVVSSALSPCGALIASGGYDHLVKLWDANSGLAVATLEGHRHMVRGCVEAGGGAAGGGGAGRRAGGKAGDLSKGGGGGTRNQSRKFLYFRHHAAPAL